MRENAAAYIAAGAAVLLVAALIFKAWLRRRPTLDEVERRRRLAIHHAGKMADGMVIDVQETAIEYSYDVRGVEYIAIQDVSGIEDRLPTDRYAAAGPVAVKYDPRNPANSIVLCEKWSGLRANGHTVNGKVH